MINSVDPNKRLSYGAVKDVVPQNVNAKLPPDVQNYDPKEQVQDSMVGSISSGILETDGMKPWQIALSVLGSIGLVFGLSALLRRSVKNNQIFKMGEKLDDLYNALKDTKGAKALSKVSDFFKKNVGEKFKKSSLGKLFAKDSSGMRPNLMTAELTVAKSQLRGSKFEACDEITDALQQMLKDGEAANESKEIIGKTANILKKPILSLKNFFLDKIAPKIGYVKKGGTRFKGEEGLRDLIKQAGHEGEADDLIKLLKNYNDNPKDMELKFMVKDKFMPIFKDFFGINKEGKISEIMNGARNKDFMQRVNLGLTHEVDMLTAVKNMMILDGQGAKTPLGRGLQKFLLKAVEAPTNGVISRSKMGLIMALTIYVGIMNKIQKAPKGEKIATAGDEITTDIGAYMMLPVNASLMYGLASLKNLGVNDVKGYRTQLKNLNQKFAEATSNIDKQAIIKEFKELKRNTYGKSPIWQKLARIPGQIMAFGLEKGPGQTKIRGFAGGALRLITMLFVLSPMLIKPIRAAASKVFGETTEYKKEKEEAKAKKAEKEQQKELKKVQKQNPQATIPMSEQELTQKLMENPEVLQKLQNDPELLQQVSNNPQMLMDMLAQNAQAQQQAQIPNNANNTVSPALRQRMNMAPQSAQIPNYTNNVQNYNVFNYPLNNNAPQSAPALQKHSNSQPAAEPKRKYVPSSKPAQVSASEITAEQKANIDRALIKADEAEASATSVL